MVERDYHQMLGISPTASEAEIKAAYRRLARKYHPDISKSPDAARRFVEVTEAYEALIDQLRQKREGQSGSGSSGSSDERELSKDSSPEGSGLSPEEMFHHAGVSIGSRQAGPRGNNTAVAVHAMMAALGIVTSLIALVCLILIETEKHAFAETGREIREGGMSGLLILAVILGQVFGYSAFMRALKRMREAETGWRPSRPRQIPRKQRRRQKKVTVGLCTVGASLGMVMILAALPCLILGGMMIDSDDEGNEPSARRRWQGGGLVVLGVLMLVCGPLVTYRSVKGNRKMEREW